MFVQATDLTVPEVRDERSNGGVQTDRFMPA
jgi:hypothetical protein